jgi:hypothetical protein
VLQYMVYRPIAAKIAKLPELMVGRRPGAVRRVPDNSRVMRPSSASAIFVAEMTIITGFAVILVLGFLSLALTLPSELWQESPNAKKSEPTAAAPPS